MKLKHDYVFFEKFVKLINFAFLNQQVVAELAAAHAEGKTNAGFDIDSDSSSTPKEDGTRHTVDAVEKQVLYFCFVYLDSKNLFTAFLESKLNFLEYFLQVFDLLMSKHWALKYATNAASTILRVDQIIMAKRAGGPKPRGGSGPMDQDDDY